MSLHRSQSQTYKLFIPQPIANWQEATTEIIRFLRELPQRAPGILSIETNSADIIIGWRQDWKEPPTASSDKP